MSRCPIRQPFLGLFALVVLKPGPLVGCDICIKHLPVLSILQDNKFIRAPDGTSPADENVARIFDAPEVARENPQISLGVIPLSPEAAEFHQQRYWQLTLKPEVVLAALISRIAGGIFEADEIGGPSHLPRSRSATSGKAWLEWAQTR
jgi:hypothetical protein